MHNKMLIDASHPEETRVVVLRGNRVEEFDFESASRKPLRGNIYLAKVTRVEPSLQAAFIEYGGNRHGFLAFAEIHPDYYQIPVADRQALLAEEAAAAEEDDEEEEERRPRRSRRRRRGEPSQRRNSRDDSVTEHAASEDADAATQNNDHTPYDPTIAGPRGEDADGDDAPGTPLADATGGAAPQMESVFSESHPQIEPSETAATITETVSVLGEGDPSDALEGGDEVPSDERPTAFREGSAEEEDDEDEDDEEEEEHVEQIGGDALEETPRRKARVRRHYKIQEVIKRRQVLLVQVVKEERGNKGAALTTYLSLAGRYSVLMPNTARGGGISRKITDGGDRKRLKSIVQDLDVPEGMGVILRTAGAARTRPEVQRDFEYLLRMWENVREMTLRSSAPTLVYEEGSLIKRAIRDLYSKEIDEVTVAGDSAWREARDFMRLIMPSHARNVVPWREAQPIFVRSGVETQLDAMFSNHVTLKSGGYLVINQTEALVAIDVNSGRSTREHNIEDTALRTNLEASDEVARQLRLRDLAGLIVVDFIDMEENRNNRAVERRLKEALKHDRARIQVGRISHFGLLEMSRQRIRTGVLEGSTAPCPHCAGSGMVRSVSSVALHVLRVLEDALTKGATHDLVVHTRSNVALYILNEKRSHLQDIESRFGVHITVAADDTLTAGVHHALERGELASGTAHAFVAPVWAPDPEDEVSYGEASVSDEAESPEEADEIEDAAAAEGGGDAEAEGEDGQRKRRRRRRRRGGAGRGEREPVAADDLTALSDRTGTEANVVFDETSAGDDARPAGRDGFWTHEATGAPMPFHVSSDANDAHPEGSVALDHVPPEPRMASASMEHYAESALPTSDAAPRDMEALPEPDLTPQSAAIPEAPAPVPADEVRPPREPTEVIITQADPSQPKRGGWWSRAKETLTGG